MMRRMGEDGVIIATTSTGVKGPSSPTPFLLRKGGEKRGRRHAKGKRPRKDIGMPWIMITIFLPLPIINPPQPFHLYWPTLPPPQSPPTSLSPRSRSTGSASHVALAYLFVSQIPNVVFNLVYPRGARMKAYFMSIVYEVSTCLILRLRWTS